MNREFFDLYVETQLAPTLRKGDVLRQENDPPDHFPIFLILDTLAYSPQALQQHHLYHPLLFSLHFSPLLQQAW